MKANPALLQLPTHCKNTLLNVPPILIEPLSEKAYKLLRQLEKLGVIRIIPEVNYVPIKLALQNS